MTVFQKIICGLIPLLVACNSGSAPAKEEASETSMSNAADSFSYDSIPSIESLKMIDTLDEASQLRLFKMALKPLKVKKLYDFSPVSQDKLLETYRHFDQLVAGYKDSQDLYISFFHNVFNRLESFEYGFEGTDTTSVKTKLEIARIKSQIRERFASTADIEATISTKP